MTKIFSLLICLISLSAQAITIDEGGLSRPRKPSILLSFEVEDSRAIRQAMVDLFNKALNNPSSVIIIEADLDGDGELEAYKTSPTKPDTDGDGLAAIVGWERVRKETSVESAQSRDCCSGMATGRRQYNPRLSLDQGQVGVEGADGSVRLSAVEERASVRRHRLQENYLEFSFAQYNPKEVILDKARKGWDGTVKGSTKRNPAIRVMLKSEKDESLSQVELKSKGSGKTEVCGSDRLCGKTDHL